MGVSSDHTDTVHGSVFVLNKVVLNHEDGDEEEAGDGVDGGAVS